MISDVRITSCPRRKDYLWRCINALKEMKYLCPTIFYDHEKKGAARNFIDAITPEMVSSCVLALQDDAEMLIENYEMIQFLNDSRLLDAHEHGQMVIISLFTHGYPESDDIVVVDTSPEKRVTSCNGGCAFMLGMDERRELLKWAAEHPEGLDQPLPQMIGQFCYETGCYYWITGKNACRHIGEVSAIEGRPEWFRYPDIRRETCNSEQQN